jgi:4'-phosphopantetheinyl transferase
MINLYLHTSSIPVTDFSSQLCKLPQTVQKHILKRKQKSKRDISLRGYLLLQKALLKDFSTELNPLTFLASGKPVIVNQNIHFNISHSGNLVGVAISRTGTLGLDIEKFRKIKKIESSFAFFSKVEQKAILTAEFPDKKLIELWSKKEALIKAVGGEMFEMSNYTDIRFSTTTWAEESYYFHAVPTSFDGEIWITSSFPVKKIITTQVEEL